MTTATTSVINALNPLRMINDFVKDVWTGSATDGAHRSLDPRRSGSRIMYCVLSLMLRYTARVWGPPSDVLLDRDSSGVQQREQTNSVADGITTRFATSLRSDLSLFSQRPMGSGQSNLSSTDGSVSKHERDRTSSSAVAVPRLSTELPKERRQAQSSLVLPILEPIFEIRPLDVIVGIISIFFQEQDEFGALPTFEETWKSYEDDKDRAGGARGYEDGENNSTKNSENVAQMACQMLHALDFATADVVVHCVKIIFEKAVKWDTSVTEAAEGRAQSTLRQQAQSAVNALITESAASVTKLGNDGTGKAQRQRHVDLSSIGQTAPNDPSAPLPGGASGINCHILSRLLAVLGLKVGF